MFPSLTGCARWEAVPREAGSVCVTFPRQCKGSLCTACFSLQDQQLLILARVRPGICDLPPQTLQQSPELSLFPLKVMMWTEYQPGSEHLSRLPESSEMGLLGMGSLPVKKRYFSPLPFSLFTAAELLLSPPYMFLIFALPMVMTLKHSYEGQSHRLQAKRAAVSCCCRKGSGQKCLCASCLQRKIYGYKEQTCFLRKSAMKVS